MANTDSFRSADVVAPLPLPPGGWVIISVLVLLAGCVLCASLRVWWVDRRFGATLRNASQSGSKQWSVIVVGQPAALDASAALPTDTESSPLIDVSLPPEPSRRSALLDAFAVQRSCAELFSDDRGALSMPFIAGLRVAASALVMLANTIHAYNYWRTLPAEFGPVQNQLFLEKQNCESFLCLFDTGYLYRVDVFFLLSGLLLSMSTLKRLQASKMHWGYLYWHRFMRLSPLFWSVLLFKFQVLPYMGAGPLWDWQFFMYENCGTGSWVTEMFFVGTLSRILG